MSEMIERVARAIYKDRNGHGCAPWSHLTGSHREPYKNDARAAIKEIVTEAAKVGLVKLGSDDPVSNFFRSL